MKPGAFAFIRPDTIEGCVEALEQGEGMSRVLAGGQSLVPMLNLRLVPVNQLVALDALEELRGCARRAWLDPLRRAGHACDVRGRPACRMGRMG